MGSEETDKREMVDLTGHWFVSFGAEVEEGKMEGSRILTLRGEFDPDTLIDVLTSTVQKSMPKYARELLEKHKQKIIIRSFNRIDNPLVGVKLA